MSQPEWDDASLISSRSSPVKQLANLADKCSVKTLPMLNKGKNNFPDSLEKLLGPLERRVHHYEPFLHPDFVHELLEAAETCEREVRDEFTWHLEIYFPLMVKALKGLRRPGDDCYIKIIPCTTAFTLPQFQVPIAAAHSVDFAVTFQPTDPLSQTQKNIDSWRP
ncbi:hypothetical protein GGS24DRAFT_496741 [Hypoxylon argillaceum]|nr:hypothetical protein GGS24DRAFT_496741 [Hypoxylon argillaceum]